MRVIMFGKYPSYNVFIEIHVKSLGNDHRDSRITKVWISVLEFDDGMNQLFGGSFGTRF